MSIRIPDTYHSQFVTEFEFLIMGSLVLYGTGHGGVSVTILFLRQ